MPYTSFYAANKNTDATILTVVSPLDCIQYHFQTYREQNCQCVQIRLIDMHKYDKTFYKHQICMLEANDFCIKISPVRG